MVRDKRPLLKKRGTWGSEASSRRHKIFREKLGGWGKKRRNLSKRGGGGNVDTKEKGGEPPGPRGGEGCVTLYQLSPMCALFHKPR